MTRIHLSIANTYIDKGDKEKARISFEHSMHISDEIGALYELKDAYEGLARLHAENAAQRNATPGVLNDHHVLRALHCNRPHLLCHLLRIEKYAAAGSVQLNL